MFRYNLDHINHILYAVKHKAFTNLNITMKLKLEYYHYPLFTKVGFLSNTNDDLKIKKSC